MTTAQPRFREGQILNAADLGAEQLARIERLALHRREQHGAGILAGLTLNIRGDTVVYDVVISAGTAVDDEGHLLIVTEPLALSIPKATGRYGIVLRRRQVEGASRSQMCPRPCVVSLGAGATVVPQGLAGFVRLGLVVRDDNGGLQTSSDGRDLMSVRAELIESASGIAELRLGRDPDRTSSRLGLYLEGNDAPVLAIDRQGESRFAGDLAIDIHRPLNATIPSHQATAQRIKFARPSTAPEAAAPWTMRRIQYEVDQQPIDELRLELAPLSDEFDPNLNRLRFPIGVDGDRDDVFLTTAGKLQVQKLDVRGRRLFEPSPPDPGDPEFAFALTHAMLAGLVWAMAIATINSGVAGQVLIDGQPAEDVEVKHALGIPTKTDKDGRFFLAAIGWPGEIVNLEFASGIGLEVRTAVVGKPKQTFAFFSETPA